MHDVHRCLFAAGGGGVRGAPRDAAAVFVLCDTLLGAGTPAADRQQPGHRHNRQPLGG
jgi:hypothetical protein